VGLLAAQAGMRILQDIEVSLRTMFVARLILGRAVLGRMYLLEEWQATLCMAAWGSVDPNLANFWKVLHIFCALRSICGTCMVS
jgi:hypothetical protein